MLLAKGILLVLCALLLTSCQTAGYYFHVSKGQLELLSQRQTIQSLLNDELTDSALKQQLQRVQAIRTFASEKLVLPDNDSYTSYADLNREYVVWNVFAAEAFSVDAKRWCFPIVGCVAYRGYFDEEKAVAFSRQLTEQGYDTYVAGVAAYSTLGWFDDPILNTFITRDETHLAALIFHELAHQQVYITEDTVFNESFATAVEREGVRRWLNKLNQPGRVQHFLLEQQRQSDFIAILLEYRERLEVFYQQSLSDEVLLAGKSAIRDKFVANEYQQFKQRWDEYNGYDEWITNDLNNAKLSTIVSYNQWLPAFEQLLQDQQGDLSRFYKAVKALGLEDEEVRNKQLLTLSLRYKEKI